MLKSVKVTQFEAGNWIKQSSYKSFSPTKINRQWLIDQPELESLIAQAHQNLGALNAFSELVPDVTFFIKMHIAKEATQSSKIEGTQTSVEEAFLKSEDIKPEKRDDWQEVQNYIQAMNYALDRLNTLPISNRLIRETHKILLQGVRGEHKQPGEFRRSQNWIGGASLADAVFVPPPHHEVPNLMGDLEQFLHNDEIFISELIRIAIAHYQFETIHPFLDGNGRMGRLLITLYLISKELLVKPSLYLSAFFDKHRQLYFDNLSNVRNKNDLLQWLKFFMVGVIETAESSVGSFRQIIILRRQLEIKINQLGKKRRDNAQLLLNYLFNQPVITSQEAAKVINKSIPTANTLIGDFVKMEILKEKTGYQRNRVFSFVEYIKLFEK